MGRKPKGLAILLSMILLVGLIGCSSTPSSTSEIKQSGGTTTQTSSSTTTETKPDDSQPVDGGILKVGVNADAVGLDPHLASAASSARIIEQIYNGLLRMNLKEYGKVEPDLAESWTISDDGKIYTFKLVQGVKFHNGREMTSDDVKYSLERIMNPKTGSPRAYMFSKVNKIETPDPYTVVITLKEPYAPLLTNLASPLNAIVPKEVVEKNGDLNQVAVGTGPFKFVKWVPQNSIELVKNPDYYVKGLPHLDGITFRPIADDTARTTAIRTGDVDFIESVPQKDIDILKKDSNVNVQGGPGTWYDYVGINVTKKPFNDVRVRQAMAWAVNRQEIVDISLFGYGTVINGGPIPKGHWAYADFKAYGPDLEKAKQLLAEAGYPNGFKATIKVGADYKSQVSIAQVLKEQLKPLGIELDVQPIEWGLFLDQWNKKKFDLVVLGWIGAVDPDDWLYAQFHSGEKWNAYGFSDKKVDELLEKGQVETDQAKRAAIYQEVQKLITEQAPYIFLHINDQYEALSPKLKGYITTPTGSFIGFRDAWLANK